MIELSWHRFLTFLSIPNVTENLDLRPSQSPGIGRSNLAPISNRGDDSIAPIAGAFASVLNQIFSHVGYRVLFLLFCSAACAAEQSLEEKPFVIIISSHNNLDWYEQNLDSVFNQNYSNYRVIYIADAPTDGTYEHVQDYIVKNQQQKRVTLLKNPEQKGHLACMCQAAFTCSKEEIIVELEGCDWLA